MPRGVNRYYTVQTVEREEANQAAVQARVPYDVSELTMPQQVAVARAIYNDVYYNNLPEWSALSIDDVVPYELVLGSFERTNEERRRPDFRVNLTGDVISELFSSFLQKELRNAIHNELYRDSRLMHYLPQGAATSRIDTEVRYVPDNNYGKLEILVTGPFWLRFFFTGRRAFTISGNPSNERSHGMLVFYDPQTGNKIVTKQVHMPAIPRGLYVEKAVRSVLNTLVDSERFDRAFRKVFKPQRISSAYYGLTYNIGNWETFQEIIVRHMRSIRGRSGIAAYDMLKEIGRGRVVKPAVVKDIESKFASQGREAAESFKRALQEYEQVDDKETRVEKVKVYAALRNLLSQTKTVLNLSDIKSMLPTNLAARSTAGGIYRSTVPRL